MQLWEDIRSTVLDHCDLAPGEGITADNQKVSQGVVMPSPESGFPQPAPEPEVRAAIESAAGPDQGRLGTFLDETVMLRNPEGTTLTALALEAIAGVELRKRIRRPADQLNHEALVCCILANGLRCYWHRDPQSVSYFRKADAYKAFGTKPAWLNGRAIGETVGLMQRAGLLVSWPGYRGNTSRFILSGAALDLAASAGATQQSLYRRRPKSGLVELRGPKSESYFNFCEGRMVKSKGEIIPFKPTDETQSWLEEISAYNSFVAAHDLAVDAPDEILSDWLNHTQSEQSHIGARLIRPELFETDIYRVFNNASFEHGGRLYGGWWINAPRSIRPYIRINGQSTAELDFASCHPRMLYHERGLECEGDLYELPDIADYERHNGLPERSSRDYIKWQLQVLINGKGRPDATPRPEALRPPEGMTAQDLIEMIRQRHAPIADAFNSQAGLRLMRTESDIALRVISKARNAGWLALPIHDSFITEESNIERLKRLMKAEYKSIMKFNPIIKQH